MNEFEAMTSKLLLNATFGKTAIRSSREQYMAVLFYPRHWFRKAWRRGGLYMCARCGVYRQTSRVRAGEYLPNNVIARWQEPSMGLGAWQLEIPECRVEHVA